mmetsp:Transcript_34466/g.90988  ORF Transcript_34466/g.90988 Transcript_34466/m.90988 type:complete len:103 (+) Transcript_34466:33-341(+)
MKEEKERQHLAELKDVAINTAADIERLSPLTISRKVGAGGKLFGTVTTKQLVEIVKSKTGAKVDFAKVKIDLPEIHSVGDYTAIFHLHFEITARLRVKVISE